jgi:nucleoid-associated protein YgaU
MAAVIHFRSDHLRSDALPARPRPSADRPARAPQLRVIHGGRSVEARQLRRTFVLRRVGVVVAVVVASWLLVQMVMAAATPLSTGAAPAAPLSSVHVVESGQTLWGLATSVDADADPRDVVDRIVAMNDPGAPGSALSADLQLLAGRELRLPVGD